MGNNQQAFPNMHFMKNIILGFCFSILLSTGAAAQYLHISPELNAALIGKRSFAEIMDVVDNYYVSRNYQDNAQLFSEYKKWNRWAWYAVRHLDNNGVVDYNAARYFEEAEKMQQYKQTNRANTNSGFWTFVGPYTTTWANNTGSKGIGRVDRLAINPANTNVLVAATPAGGLWKTNDGGLNWFSISSNIPNCGISGVVISADDPSGNKIFILTGDGDSSGGGFVENFGFGRPCIGILSTVDGGATWAVTGNSGTLLAGTRGYKLLQVRGTPARLLAATNDGIYRTDNYGATWVQNGFVGSNLYDMEQHPTNDAVLYAAGGNTVIISVNNGQSFTLTPTFTPASSSSNRSALAVTPANPNEVYFLQCGASNRLYKSTDSGNNFNSINTTDLIGGQYSYNCALAVNPANNNFILAGGINILSSADNGSNFLDTTKGLINSPPPPNYVHSDVHDLVYTPNGYLVYAATDGGVFVSNDDGINWDDRSNGLSSTQYYHMTGYNGTYNLLLGGAQDNGTAYTTNGSNMEYCSGGDGFSVSFVSNDNDIFYMVANTLVRRYRRSTHTRSEISPGTNTDQTFYPSVIAHPTNNNILYVGYMNSIWRSSNQGDSWTNISSTGSSNSGSTHTGGLAVTAAFPDRLYAANETVVRRSDNQGTNWVTISGTSGWPSSFGSITDMACRNTSPDEIWVTTTGNNGLNRVLYSGDAGATWINFTGSLPNMPVYSIVYDASGDAYIGTELGVFFMDYNMTDWVPFYNGMPLVPVTDLFVNETFGTIQASTFGRGIWESDLYTNCGPAYFLTGLTEGQRFYQSNGVIETTQYVPGSFGNELRLRSPVKIVFSNGFRSYNNSFLHAVIGNCGQGVFDMAGSEEAVIPKSEMMKILAKQWNDD